MLGETRFIVKKASRFERRKKKLWGDKSNIWVPIEKRYTDLNRYAVDSFDPDFTRYKDRDFVPTLFIILD